MYLSSSFEVRQIEVRRALNAAVEPIVVELDVRSQLYLSEAEAEQLAAGLLAVLAAYRAETGEVVPVRNDHVWDTNGVCQVHGGYCSMSPTEVVPTT